VARHIIAINDDHAKTAHKFLDRDAIAVSHPSEFAAYRLWGASRQMSGAVRYKNYGGSAANYFELDVRQCIWDFSTRKNNGGLERHRCLSGQHSFASAAVADRPAPGRAMLRLAFA
jgi:hypothetical protein